MVTGVEQFVRAAQFEEYREPILKDNGQGSFDTIGSCLRHSNLEM